MMKHLTKYFLAAVIVIFSTVALGTAYSSYDNGNLILLPKDELEQIEESLDTLGLPFGTGIMTYDGEVCSYIESRAELMPIIENILAASDRVIPVYRGYHTALFRAIVLSGIAVCLWFVIMSTTFKKRIISYLMLTAAFLIAYGCMYWLKLLTLTIW